MDGPPPEWTLGGSTTDDKGWAFARERLKQIQIGDKVIPFPRRWRDGPVGTVTSIKVADAEWNPTIRAEESKEGKAGIGRRILVNWEQVGMPLNGMLSTVPKNQRPKGSLALHTIEDLTPEKFPKLCSFLSDRSNWIDMTTDRIDMNTDTDEEPPEAPEDAEPSIAEQMKFLEKDLQGFLSRNLHAIEPGLKQHPEYDLEQHPTGVGYIDLLCQDQQNNLVVVELKAGAAGDSAIGQISGYMSWVRDNLAKGSNVRGIIICMNPTDRILAAAKIIPGLSIKRYSLSFSIQDAS